MKSAASTLAPWPASQYIREFDVVAQGAGGGGEVADDRERGVGVLGSHPDPPVPRPAGVLVPDVVHGVHQVQLLGDVGVEPLAPGAAGAELVVLARGQVEGVEGRNGLLPRADVVEAVVPGEGGPAALPGDEGVLGQVGRAVGRRQVLEVRGDCRLEVGLQQVVVVVAGRERSEAVQARQLQGGLVGREPGPQVLGQLLVDLLAGALGDVVAPVPLVRHVGVLQVGDGAPVAAAGEAALVGADVPHRDPG